MESDSTTVKRNRNLHVCISKNSKVNVFFKSMKDKFSVGVNLLARLHGRFVVKEKKVRKLKSICIYRG